MFLDSLFIINSKKKTKANSISNQTKKTLDTDNNKDNKNI